MSLLIKVLLVIDYADRDVGKSTFIHGGRGGLG